MDAVTHVLAGYALAIGAGALAARWGRRRGADRRQWAAVAGAAALAPDLDVLFLPLTFIDWLYPLQHRGVTHSLVGAPIMAGLAMAALVAAGRRWRPFSVFTWHNGLVWPLLLGAWSHLILDLVTHSGVPLAWPWTEQRVTLGLYYWIVWWLAPASFLPLALRYRGRWDDRRVAQAGAVVLAVLVVLGGVRAWAMPAGDEVYPTRDPMEWIVAQPHENRTWQLDLVQRSTVLQTAWYVPYVPPDADGALAQVKATYAYRGFRFGSTAPHVDQVEPAPGGWNVTIVDVVQRFEQRIEPDWMPQWRDDVGLFQAQVVNGTVHVTGRWG